VTQRGPGDRLVAVGAALFAVGVLATIVTVAPYLLGTTRLPTPAYVVCMLGPVGFGIALLGLVRAGRARVRAHQGPDPTPR